MKCSICSSTFSGRYYEANSSSGQKMIFCPSCHRKYYQCAACCKPLDGEFIIEQVRGGDKITERFICMACKDRLHVCDYCGNRITESIITYPSGLETCRYCHDNAINSTVSIRSYYRKVQKNLTNWFSMKIKTPINLVVATAAELADIHGIPLKATRGYDARSSALFRYRDNKFSVFVEKGFCSEHVETALAHELTHAYHQEVVPKYHDPVISEGFATWIEYRYAKKANYHYEWRKLDLMLASGEDDEYRRGLRLFLQIEKERGIIGPFEYIRERA